MNVARECASSSSHCLCVFLCSTSNISASSYIVKIFTFAGYDRDALAQMHTDIYIRTMHQYLMEAMTMALFCVYVFVYRKLARNVIGARAHEAKKTQTYRRCFPLPSSIRRLDWMNCWKRHTVVCNVIWIVMAACVSPQCIGKVHSLSCFGIENIQKLQSCFELSMKNDFLDSSRMHFYVCLLWKLLS